MRYSRTILNRLLQEEHGQTLVFVAVAFTVLLAMTGFALDAGRLFYVSRQLQASSDAAALAGAAELPASDASTLSKKFSSVGTYYNALASLPNVSFVSGYPKVLCLSTLQAQGMACASPGNGNAVQIKQQVVVPLLFMRIVGISTYTVGATATASMSGGPGNPPSNIAIIVDNTGSMNDTDSDSSCSDTRLNCALAGVQTLLQGLSPCPSNQSTCGTATNGVVANPVDQVALYTFPAVTTSTDAQHEYDCSGKTPKNSNYTDSVMPIYQIVNFSSDYKVSASKTQSLNTGSNLVNAVNGNSKCSGLQAEDGIYTFSAGAIYQATLDLLAIQQKYPSSQNAIVILTDGDMNTPSSQLPNASKSSGNYPSQVNQCAQAVAMAQNAAQNGIAVYAVAYGATTGGCKYDSSLNACQTVQGMASSPQNFFSDYKATGGTSACASSSHTATSLAVIFKQIAQGGVLSYSRLIPDGTT